MEIILNSYGTSLQKENNLFVIYSKEGKRFVPPSDISAISVSKGAKVSSDAVMLAIEHEIDLLFIDGKGMPLGRVWSVKYGSIATIRKNQLEFIFEPRSVLWVKQLISEKLDNMVALLLSLEAEDDRLYRMIQSALSAFEDYKRKIQKSEGEVISEVSASFRGWEGAASRRYFQLIAEFMPESYKFEKRSQNPALDKFNALLNYGYGMLYGKVEGALIKAGIDPYVGIFHRDDYNRPVLVYDVIEKYRVWIDYVVIKLCKEEVFIEECFTEKNGACWLDALGKRILIQSVNDYLAEIVSINGLERARSTHIELYGQQLAAYFGKK